VQILQGAPFKKQQTRKHPLKPNPKELDEKKIRAVARELKAIQRQVLNPPSIRLKEPIQRGWLRKYVPTKEAQSRPDAQVLEEILKVIGTTQYHWRRVFVRGRRAGRHMIEMKQPLKEILIDTWKRYPTDYPDTWKRYFHLEYKQGGYVWYGLQSGHQWHYVFTDAHLFELKVERFWLTHVKIIDPLLIEHQAELEAWMESKRGWERYGRLKGRSNWWNKSPLQRKLEARAQRDLRRFVANPEEAEMSLRMMQFRFSLFVLIFPHVAQCRGTPLRTETVRVQILSWGPFPLVAQPAEALLSKRRGCGCESRLGDIFRSCSPIEEATDLRSV
jgi:hypothetical protein